MTKNERIERNKDIIQYRLDGHTLEETLIYAREKYKLGTLGQINNVWKEYKLGKGQWAKKEDNEENTAE